MHPFAERLLQSRRDFLTTSANGVGLLALASLLKQDGLLASETAGASSARPALAHFAPKAKNCIFIYLEGGPSQLDLFDPKPKLLELNGQPTPKSFVEGKRFAFLKPDA